MQIKHGNTNYGDLISRMQPDEIKRERERYRAFVVGLNSDGSPTIRNWKRIDEESLYNIPEDLFAKLPADIQALAGNERDLRRIIPFSLEHTRQAQISGQEVPYSTGEIAWDIFRRAGLPAPAPAPAPASTSSPSSPTTTPTPIFRQADWWQMQRSIRAEKDPYKKRTMYRDYVRMFPQHPPTDAERVWMGLSSMSRQYGGIIPGFQTGGKLPGYGGGDRNIIAAEDGEFIVRKEMYAKHGKLVDAINKDSVRGFQKGGPIYAVTGADVSNAYTSATTPLPGTVLDWKEAGKDLQAAFNQFLNEIAARVNQVGNEVGAGTDQAERMLTEANDAVQEILNRIAQARTDARK